MTGNSFAVRTIWVNVKGWSEVKFSRFNRVPVRARNYCILTHNLFNIVYNFVRLISHFGCSKPNCLFHWIFNPLKHLVNLKHKNWFRNTGIRAQKGRNDSSYFGVIVIFVLTHFGFWRCPCNYPWQLCCVFAPTTSSVVSSRKLLRMGNSMKQSVYYEATFYSQNLSPCV